MGAVICDDGSIHFISRHSFPSFLDGESSASVSWNDASRDGVERLARLRASVVVGESPARRARARDGGAARHRDDRRGERDGRWTRRASGGGDDEGDVDGHR